MARIIMFLLESILISAILYLLYLALFREKASYVGQRIMLVAIPIVATISACVSFDLIQLDGYSKDLVSQVIANSDVIVDESNEPREFVSEEGFRIIRNHVWSLGVEELVLISWGVVSLVLLSIFIARLSKILSLRRVAECEKHPDFSIYRFCAQDILFSFWRSVYLCRDLQGTKFDFVLSHELAHIRRCHYIDKIIIEILSVLLWFNPIVRVVQRELSLVHEYEADHSVVKSGCDVKAYKIFIFEEVTAEVPAFANGLNSSQIKKRFIAMSKGYRVSHRMVRALSTLALLAVVAMMSLVYVEASELNLHKTNIGKSFSAIVQYDNDETQYEADVVVQKAPSIDARAEQMLFTEYQDDYKSIYVVRCEDHTKVYVGFEVMWDLHWFVISQETALIDPRTMDKYMLHSCATGLPLSKIINVRNQIGKLAYFEMIFPPLDKDVSVVNFREWTDKKSTEGYNRVGPGWYYPRVAVDNELPFFARSGY
ncbi:MAG: M56 family metallopeptidase [Rikenellaceae bacterium]